MSVAADVEPATHLSWKVKHTFLEFDTDAGETGKFVRNSSDPGPLNKYKDNSNVKLADCPAGFSLGACEKLMVPGFSDIEDEDTGSEDESTAVSSYCRQTSHGVSSFGSVSGTVSFDSALMSAGSNAPLASASHSEHVTYLSLAEVKLPNSGKLVVKHTFLELETSDTSSDEAKAGGRRASSDPGVGKNEVKSDFESGSDEDVSDDEKSVLYCPRTMSYEGVPSFGVQPFEDQQVQPEMLPAKADSQESQRDQPSRIYLERLSSENSRLAAENALLRQQCLEVARAAESVAAATASAAAVCWTDPDVSTDVPDDKIAVKAKALPPGALPPGALPPAAPTSSDMPTTPAAIREDPSKQSRWWSCLVPGTDAEISQSSRQVGKHMVTHRGSQRAEGSRWSLDESVESTLCTVPAEERTTVYLRNIPNNYSRQMFLDLIDCEGFACQYDFVYLPTDFKSRANLGYAFVNLVSPRAAQRFMKIFHGFCNWILPSKKVCAVSWSGPHQGLEAHVNRYRNSTVMHKAVPDAYKPVVFQDGVRVQFPPPTKRVREPRVRPSIPGSMYSESADGPQSGPAGFEHLDSFGLCSGKSEQDVVDTRNDEQWWLLLHSGA